METKIEWRDGVAGVGVHKCQTTIHTFNPMHMGRMWNMLGKGELHEFKYF